MILWFLTAVLGELNEKGYLFSVGKEQFLSLEGDKVKLIEKSKMPNKFEIETRGGAESYYLRIYPSPRQGDKVMDKDWWYNDHKLIFYPNNDWMSQHFVFSLLPKNMLKIMVKDRCAEVKEDGSLKASLCKSRSDNKYQYFRWIREEDKRIVQTFVRKHGGMRRFGSDEELGYRNYGGPNRRWRDRDLDMECEDDIDCEEEDEKYGRPGYKGDYNGGYTRDYNGGYIRDYNGGYTRDYNGGYTRDYNGGYTRDYKGGNNDFNDDDFFIRKTDRGMRRRNSRQIDGYDFDEDFNDQDEDLSSYRESKRRGPHRKRRSPLAEAMCSDDIDEIGKIICEINKMPNLVL